jgi:hypothetical protein
MRGKPLHRSLAGAVATPAICLREMGQGQPPHGIGTSGAGGVMRNRMLAVTIVLDTLLASHPASGEIVLIGESMGRLSRAKGGGVRSGFFRG